NELTIDRALRSGGPRRADGSLRPSPRRARTSRCAALDATDLAVARVRAAQSAAALPARRGTRNVRTNRASTRAAAVARAEWLQLCVLGTRFLRRLPCQRDRYPSCSDDEEWRSCRIHRARRSPRP